MSRTSRILAPLAAALALGLSAGRSFGQEAVIVGPATVTPISASAYPGTTTVTPTVAYYSAPAAPTVAYYASPAPVVVSSYYSSYYAPAPVVASSYYAPAASYSPSEVVVRPRLFRPPVVRYYYGPSAYVYP